MPSPPSTSSRKFRRYQAPMCQRHARRHDRREADAKRRHSIAREMKTSLMPASTGFLDHSTRHLFFTGKGGVGKTSLSTAAALALAGAGKKVLLVSTDAASNLDEMLGIELRNTPVPVPGAPGLSVLNIDPSNAAEAYRE